MFIRNTLKVWLPLAAAVTMLAGLVYISGQQVYRMGANDPQIQLAEDGARALANGEAAQTLVPAAKVDIATSLAPYLIVFDASGKPVASNALLNGQIPSLPNGVLDETRKRGEDRISYQPEPGVRSAVVIAAADGGRAGFVLAGRSLREAENRTGQLAQITGLGWGLTMVVTLGLVGILEVLLRG